MDRGSQIVLARECVVVLQGVVGRLEAGEDSPELAGDCSDLRRRLEALVDEEHRRLWGVYAERTQ